MEKDQNKLWLLIACSIAVSWVFMQAIVKIPFFRDFFSEDIQWYIGFVLISLFLLSAVNWLPFFRDKEWVSERLKTLPYPTLFLLIGIFGTFLGIYFGLLKLDGAKSIGVKELTGLIKGLTFSFTTSIAGIALTFLYRFLMSLFGPSKKHEAGAPEIIQAIDGMGDKLDTFIEDLNKKVVEGLSQALKDLVSNLENIITDQLGQAFKELNASIVSLNKWVIEYRQQVETLTQSYTDNLIGIDAFHEKAKEITDALEPLPGYMTGIEDTLEKMNKPLAEFSALGVRARDAFPIIENNLKKLTDDFGQSAGVLQAAQKKTADLTKELSDKTGDVEKLITDATNRQLETFASELAAISKKFADDYTPIAVNLKTLLDGLDTRGRNE